MVADYMTKPLLGAKFQKFCKAIMNGRYKKKYMINKVKGNVMVGQQECVGFDIFRRLKPDCNKQESDLFSTRPTTKLQTRTNKKHERNKKSSHCFKLILLAQVYSHHIIIFSFYVYR
jgi:hypothetical protein